MRKPITHLKCFAGPTVYSLPQILSFFMQLGKLLDIHQTVFFSSFLLAYPDLQLLYFLTRASEIWRKKKQNFAGFLGANSRKNRPISRDFRGKKVKIRGKIGQFRRSFDGEKSNFTEKSADFAGF